MKKVKFFLLSTFLFAINTMFAKGDVTGALNTATSTVTSAFEAASNLMLAVGAVVGLIGGITCYSKFSSGDPEGGKRIAKWIGGAVFLCLVPTILKGFFF